MLIKTHRAYGIIAKCKSIALRCSIFSSLASKSIHRMVEVQGVWGGSSRSDLNCCLFSQDSSVVEVPSRGRWVFAGFSDRWNRVARDHWEFAEAVIAVLVCRQSLVSKAVSVPVAFL
jgi:hypothetical protein